MGFVPLLSYANYTWLWFKLLDLKTIYDGSNVPQINHRNLVNLIVKMPPEEEAEIIYFLAEEALSKADKVEATLDAQARQAKALKQAVLKTAFEGNLVPQNPDDEPASELLKRIKAVS